MELSNLAIKKLVEELKALEGGFLNKVQKIDGGLKIRIHKEGMKTLVWKKTLLWLSNLILPAKNPDGNIRRVNKLFFNAKIDKIYQKDMERIVVFETTKGKIVFELFSKGNALFLSEGKIVFVYREEKWSTRVLKINEYYTFPPGKKEIPENFDDFKKGLDENKLFKSIISSYSVVPQVVEKVLKEENDIREIWAKLLDIQKGVLLDEPCLYKIGKKEVVIPYVVDYEKIICGKSVSELLDLINEKVVLKNPEKERIEKTINEIKKKLEERKEEISQLEDVALKLKENAWVLEELRKELLENIKQDEKKLEEIGKKYGILIKKIDKKERKVVFEL